ncbi:hypothetical protein ABPG74_022879 [Tetrahymena malaccensis]
MVSQKVKELYPNAQVEGKAIPGGSGAMEVTISVGEKSQKIWSKLGGDSRIDQNALVELTKRLQEFVSSS